MWIAFSALGFLVGNLTGLSASPISSILIPALFALFGGSLIGFLSKIDAVDRRITAACLGGFSVACLIGVYIGILVNSHNILGDKPFAPRGPQDMKNQSDQSVRDSIANDRNYLRGISINELESIDLQVRQNQLSPNDAYKKIIILARGEK